MSNQLIVPYAVTGTATNGDDYQTLTGSVTIPIGAPSATFSVTPIQDTADEGNETVIATLTAPAGYALGTPFAATATIFDNDGGTDVITDFVGEVPEALMDEFSLDDATFTLPAADADGELQQVQIAPPEDLTAPYVRGIDWDGVENPDGSVTLTFTRHGPYVARVVRADSGGPSEKLLSLVRGGGWAESIPTLIRGKSVRIPVPTGDLVLVSDAFDFANFAARQTIGPDNYTLMSSVADAVEDIQDAFIANNLQKITVALFDHGAPGLIIMGGGVNAGSGEYIAYQNSASADDLATFIDALSRYVSRIDFYGCAVAKSVLDSPSTPNYHDNGAAFLQSIASGSGAVVTGYTKSTAATWLPVVGGNFWVVKGGTRASFVG